jgi:hypothetical protein
VDSGLFLRAAAIQAAGVAVLFAILLALPLSEDFFEDYGWAVGPVAWIACALVTGRVLRLPLALVAVAAIAGGVAGTLIGLASTHFAGLVVAVAVFGAACGGYEEEDRAQPVG